MNLGFVLFVLPSFILHKAFAFIGQTSLFRRIGVGAGGGRVHPPCRVATSDKAGPVQPCVIIPRKCEALGLLTMLIRNNWKQLLMGERNNTMRYKGGAPHCHAS